MYKKVDILENKICEISQSILETLIKDRSSKKNIIWATDAYASRGYGYQENDEIALTAITGRNGLVIKPRIEKSKKTQQIRVRDKAEVFTPSWMCNSQNNLIDNAWFEKENVFNFEKEKTWVTNFDKIEFPNKKVWQDYVKANRLEITCGEAPYLASRYDTVSGERIDIKNRIGILDRKVRVINENIKTEEDWHKWVLAAFKATFGFEWQGDSLLIARENMLYTYIEYYIDRFAKQPSKEQLVSIAEVISWNIWQMDGLKFVIPNSCKSAPQLQRSLFEEDSEECYGCKNDDKCAHTGIYCKIMDWETGKAFKFVDLLKGR